MSLETMVESAARPKLSAEMMPFDPSTLRQNVPPSDERIAEMMTFASKRVEIVPYAPEDLIESDGEPLESQWHVLQINLLCEIVAYHLRSRNDYFVGGNMFIYYNKNQARNVDFRGPDFFFVNGGVTNTSLRPYWAVWEENERFPNVIIELLSPSTRKIDLTVKKAIYEETFQTKDYFCFDPDSQELFGWTLVNNRYQRLDPEQAGRLRCDELGLYLGTWHGAFQGKTGSWLRFFDSHGELAPTFGEGEKLRADQLAAELAELKGRMKP